MCIEQESKIGKIWRLARESLRMEVLDCKKKYRMGPHEKQAFFWKNCTPIYIIICLCLRLYLGSQSRSAYMLIVATVTCAWEASLLCKCQSMHRCASYPGETENLGCGKRET